MGKRVVTLEIKREMVEKIESGETVKSISEEYGVNRATIYSWLKKDAEGGNESLSLNKLKRENKALLELVGRLTYEKELREKKGFKL